MENGFGKEIRGHRCIAHFNSNFIAGCGGFRFDARLGVGLNIPLLLFKVYLEADADFPLTSKTRSGGGSNISAFNYQAFYVGGGLDFRF